MIKTILNLAGQYIDFCNPVYFIAKEFYPDSSLSTVCRKDFQNVSPYPEGASLEIHIISCILYINQLPDNIITIPFHARPQRYHHLLEVLRFTQSIDTGYTGNDNNIPPFRQCCCSRQTQFINLIIHRRILCDISIRGWHICLRLVVIVIGDKVLYCIFGEKFLEFSIELRRQCLIM